MRSAKPEMDVTPSASRLTTSLRDIGYDFVSAVADLVDNSISAGANQIDIETVFEGVHSHVIIADDGSGMSERELTEALRFGTRRGYDSDDLGRYGLGLKTASLSQCRRVTVLTRRAPVNRKIAVRTLDLDHIVETDRWELTHVPDDTRAFRAFEWLNNSPGTVVVWERLDRILPSGRPEGGGARRRLDSLSNKLVGHLGAVFHRFIEGSTVSGRSVVITINGSKVPAWNPFATDEEHTVTLPPREFEVWVGDSVGTVRFSPFVLPAKELFSSQEEFERLSGPAKWNRQQGLYIYRGDRLIQSGGWAGIRAIDEHTKLARAALDFDPDLDDLFRINVAKMRAALPAEIRPLLESHVTELCHRAQDMYRREVREGSGTVQPALDYQRTNAADIGGAILSASLATGTTEAFAKIAAHLSAENPSVFQSLGW